ncbi:predicted ATPase [Pelotomaculum thermopropionicum SI]|uniref:Predicted ATPase n=1 Tax=Pelotomaculum thermopropionicum (strain DSM 13744 / JCM 10971 / SI) TaxID=370438 RepID=A5D0N9_PELTS|nr:predicted ATPase [Pelotomaculum thermopropionicum SI]
MNNAAKTAHPAVLADALRAARGLAVYRNILKDPVCLALVRFIEAVTGAARPEEVLESYCNLFFLLSEKALETKEEPVGDAWQNHLLQLLLYDDNAFSRAAAAASFDSLGLSLRKAAEGDLIRLQLLYRVDAAAARDVALQVLGEGCVPEGGLPVWDDLGVSAAGCRPAAGKKHARKIKVLLNGSGNWGACLRELAEYYRLAGAGIFGRYWAFRWAGRFSALEGIEEPDPTRLEELIGYRPQQQEVLANTERFLAGLPANNLLLYGDRGTGKSSTVKALLNRYGEAGLRLVEISKSFLGDLPYVISILKSSPQRFIIFIDDLSFEESEVEYKELKAVLEGGLARWPSNVLIYATSNRRHLIREVFGDRETAQGSDREVRENDTMQEKLSLADRFGITVLFPMPDRSLYLDIVRGLAEQRGLSLDKKELERRALLWEAWQNGCSGRTARQFVDHISGELLQGF